MAGFFDSDSEDESLPAVPPPLRAGSGVSAGAGGSGAGPSRRPDARPSGGLGSNANATSFRQRLESTLSPSRSFSGASESIGGGGGGSGSRGVRVAGTDTGTGASRSRMGDDDISMRGSSAFGESGPGQSRARDTDVDMDTPRAERHRRAGTDMDVDEDALQSMLGEDDESDDVRRLSRAWVKERGTQAIMQWEGDLMDELFDKLEQQQKMVDLLKSDPKTSEEEHFKLMLVMTEMERVKYLVRSYVRTRLAKIERFSFHITLTPELHPLLSGAELSHAQRYTDLLHTHYRHSVLDSLPEWLRNMDDNTSGTTDMIPKPNPDLPVLIYCRRDCGEIDLRLRDGEVPFLAKGSTHLVKYSLVERWIALGWAEVL